MSNFIKNIFIGLFGQNPELTTFVTSMLPIIEMKGALPLGMSTFWSYPLNAFTSLGLCFLGGLIMSGILLFVLSKLIPRLKRTATYQKLVSKFKKKSNTLDSQKSDTNKYLLLCLFTLVPIPFTGYYTSCIIASICNMHYLKSWIFINIGNLLSGIVIILLSFISHKMLNIFFYVFFSLFIVYSAYIVILFIFKRINHQI